MPLNTDPCSRDLRRWFAAPRRIVAAGVLAVAMLATAACSTQVAAVDAAAPDGEPSAASAVAQTAETADTGEVSDAETNAQLTAFDASQVHTISVVVDPDDFAEMIDAYAADGSKEWIEADVTIDGVTYASAGLRLKGNSSLRGVANTASVAEAADLPWLIKLDKYVDDQNHQGINDFVVRSNNSETSLNEAVALSLLGEAGLATQEAMAVRFSVNDSVETLRLVIEHPDDVWMVDEFGTGGALYKAESTGDYSYRGDDPDSYDDVFDQEAGKDNFDLEPLIDFLEFINTSDEATFAAEIDEWLDVDAFATYLAMQEVVDNFDDIDGPGNNSYLYYDPVTGRFTVVPWDYNLSFGISNEGGPGGGFAGPGGLARGGGEAPEGFEPPEGFAGRPGGGFGGPDGATRPDGAGGAGFGGPGAGSNVLVERMMAIDEFATLVDQRLGELTENLVTSGVAADVVSAWTEVLTHGAADLVSPDTIISEATRLTEAL